MACAFVWGPEWRTRGPWHFCLRDTNLFHSPLGRPPWPPGAHISSIEPTVLATLEKAGALHGNPSIHPYALPSLEFFAWQNNLPVPQTAQTAQAPAPNNAVPTQHAPAQPTTHTPAAAATHTHTPAAATPNVNGNGQGNDIDTLAVDLASVQLSTLFHDHPILQGPPSPPRLTVTCPREIPFDESALADLHRETLWLLNDFRFDEKATVTIASIWRDCTRNSTLNPVRFTCQLIRIGVPEHMANMILDTNGSAGGNI